MDDQPVFSQVSMHIIRGCLIVSVQAELYDNMVNQLQEDVLKKVHESGVKGVVLDVSTVEIMDSFIAKSFSDMTRMATMLGAQTVLVGIKPVVAIALTDLDISLADIRTALTAEQALQMLEPFVWPNGTIQNTADNEAVEQNTADGIDDEYPTSIVLGDDEGFAEILPTDDGAGSVD
ncbi:STAS domain-containing protein [Marinobacter caseinilyticus]|uniref:STAS domain-containing protein n=1 Tax=Marinobacter caseinilyticus TaxID=2692195 RepID=UPI001A94122E|nr:STAS domain-containing protein [Marinobacter caseinilyticus]